MSVIKNIELFYAHLSAVHCTCSLVDTLRLIVYQFQLCAALSLDSKAQSKYMLLIIFVLYLLGMEKPLQTPNLSPERTKFGVPSVDPGQHFLNHRAMPGSQCLTHWASPGPGMNPVPLDAKTSAGLDFWVRLGR